VEAHDGDQKGDGQKSITCIIRKSVHVAERDKSSQEQSDKVNRIALKVAM